MQILQQLNEGYIRSVQSSGVLERAAFLAQIARPAGVSDFQAHDVRIRAFGDMAIITRG